MDNEKLLKTIEELIKENNKLMKLNTLLTKGIETIKAEAMHNLEGSSRNYISNLCDGVLKGTNLYQQKLEEKEVKIVESNY